jgi:hypothetical protein
MGGLYGWFVRVVCMGGVRGCMGGCVRGCMGGCVRGCMGGCVRGCMGGCVVWFCGAYTTKHNMTLH